MAGKQRGEGVVLPRHNGHVPGHGVTRLVAMSATRFDAPPSTGWWTDAVIYQIYPRSFAASTPSGVGDLRGIAQRMPALASLGVDAVWLSPFFTSPQKDAGYDVADYCDIDPLFGTLADFDHLATTVHGLGLKLIVDLVPNHSSSAHVLFQAALASEPGSPERAMYIFRDGKGEGGTEPPNDWQSVFGGPAWTRTENPDGTPGQWYLHLFDSSQPDFDWNNERVWDLFDDVLRFWLDRGVDGFRVDVAHGLIKKPGLPDIGDTGEIGGAGNVGPFWNQDGVHDVYRRWRKVLAEYGPDRILAAEAWVMPLSDMAKYVREDEMHQAFNFGYLMTPWKAQKLRDIITESLTAFHQVGAPSTWVLSNHDVIRHPSRLAIGDAMENHLDGLGPKSPFRPDPDTARLMGRGATALMLALPGSSYLYQGEELGLPEVVEIPDEKRQDPTFHRTNGERYGRDGCRVPIPWEKDSPTFGFAPGGEPWLPQPEIFGDLARDQQDGDPDSSLTLYRHLLRVRKEFGLGRGALSFVDGYPEDVVVFDNGPLRVVANLSESPVPLPAGEVVAASTPVEGDQVTRDQVVWVRREA
jgi:alpha-glucosidase